MGVLIVESMPVKNDKKRTNKEQCMLREREIEREYHH